ncbi:hypothetical protein EDWATA_02945 [Edwardsiella tarda ATCC 23685]|uniref:Uncharacterized protein n=1 Tax=Edwardsiella tarda ATCC 23685 TaxID=500638 RepID=D4F858_EDWTA|nr:hypothetical protein EDWATA_02945 [Edwardsiella tarda ATCC 23685]
MTNEKAGRSQAVTDQRLSGCHPEGDGRWATDYPPRSRKRRYSVLTCTGLNSGWKALTRCDDDG